MSHAFALRARAVFPVDRPPIDGGVVTIDDERIVAVGRQCLGSVTVCDLGDVALLPGLVNAHTHLEFSHLAHPLGQPGMAIADWIRLAISERNRCDRSPAEAIAVGMAESLGRGVTTLGEIATASSLAYFADEPVSALRCFHEIIGFSRARADSAFEALENRLAEFETIHSPANQDRSCRLAHGISPHAPYTVNPDLLDRLVTLARQRSLPIAMHLAETGEELQLLGTGTGQLRELLEERSMWDAGAIERRTRPIDYLIQMATAPRAVVIHGNYLTNDDLAFLADRRDRMSLVYCPRTHAYFRHPPYTLTEAIEAGVRVALGTDSRASNPDLCVLSEMRTVRSKHPAVAPTDILRMGTQWSAESLGVGESVGTLTPGKFADIIAIPIERFADRADPGTILENHTSPSAVWLRGERTTIRHESYG